MKLGLALLAVTGLAASSRAEGDFPRAPGPGCSKAAVAAAGAEVKAARGGLRAIPLGDEDTLIPPQTGRHIERVKDRLRAFVRAEMACAPDPPDLDALGASMVADGDAFIGTGFYDPRHPPPDRHGNMLTYQVGRVASHGDMLAVVATLGIKCGSDSMLMLYRRVPGGGWKELMILRSAPYREVSGGWQDLRFAVSPPDAQGKWFVATVSTTPWCTSAWQGMPYQLARPGPEPDRPRVFFRGKGGVYLGNESDLFLKAEPDAVEIRHDGSSLDPDILIRRHVRRYAVAGESVRRVQPVAESVRDFADEWIDSPWAEARTWSASDPALLVAHSGLRAARHKTLGGFASIRACSGGATQLELAGQDGPGWFLLVRGGAKGPWTMERVARRAEAGCTGPDILKREIG